MTNSSIMLMHNFSEHDHSISYVAEYLVLLEWTITHAYIYRDSSYSRKCKNVCKSFVYIMTCVENKPTIHEKPVCMDGKKGSQNMNN